MTLHSFKMDENTLRNSVLVCEQLLFCPFISGRLFKGLFDMDLKTRSIAIQVDPTLSPGRSSQRKVSVYQVSTFSLGGDEEKVLRSILDDVRLAYPLMNTVIAPLETMRVRLFLGPNSPPRNPRYFSSIASVGVRDGFGKCDGLLDAEPYPTVLVTNEFVYPITLVTTTAIGWCLEIKTPCMFVVTKAKSKYQSTVAFMPVLTPEINDHVGRAISPSTTPSARDIDVPVSVVCPYRVEPGHSARVLVWALSQRRLCKQEFLLTPTSQKLGLSWRESHFESVVSNMVSLFFESFMRMYMWFQPLLVFGESAFWLKC